MNVVALGGGHGLFATIRALRLITPNITAIVCVGDNGGSSGRLRSELPILPPGDIRMAICALSSREAQHSGLTKLLQYRFSSRGELDGHALGNLLLSAAWMQSQSIIDGINLIGSIVDMEGRVLPGAAVPLTLQAQVRNEETGELRTVYGQRQIAKPHGRIEHLEIFPNNPPAVPEAIEAIMNADIVVMGPGSWYSSLLVHMLVPEIQDALSKTTAHKILLMNLLSDAETTGFNQQCHIEAFHEYAPHVMVDLVIAQEDETMIAEDLQPALQLIKADSILRNLASAANPAVHDHVRLAAALHDGIEYLIHRESLEKL